jgi:hypothetical protein
LAEKQAHGLTKLFRALNPRASCILGPWPSAVELSGNRVHVYLCTELLNCSSGNACALPLPIRQATELAQFGKSRQRHLFVIHFSRSPGRRSNTCSGHWHSAIGVETRAPLKATGMRSWIISDFCDGPRQTETGHHERSGS